MEMPTVQKKRKGCLVIDQGEEPSKKEKKARHHRKIEQERKEAYDVGIEMKAWRCS